MARRKKSLARRIVVLSILGLAAFGGWTLYKQNQEDVNNGVSKVEKKAKAVKRALEE